MSFEEYKEFKHECVHARIDKNDRNIEEFRIGSYDTWAYDQESGVFTFSNVGEPLARAIFLISGSIASTSGTWLWSWANPHMESKLVEPVLKVREFGDQNGILELSEQKFEADIEDGWELTAVVVEILGLKGAYKCPHENGAMFVMFTGIYFNS